MGDKMATEWQLSGDYFEACNCDTACQCIWLEAPDDGACTAGLAWNIRDGTYGDTDLSGLSVGLLARSEEGVMFDPDVPWHVVLIVDEEADDEQRAAIEDIYLGRAGGIFAAVADTHVESAEVATAPIDFTRDGSRLAVEIGDSVSMEVVGSQGLNDEPVTISPHPLTSSREMKVGESTTATVDYNDEFTWDVAGNNSYYCDFELANA